MELLEKLEILSDAAKYDVSCSSSGSTRQNTPGGIGNAEKAGICHTWADDGRCISLLKILLSNECIYDCVYCLNRRSNDVPRATFTADEVADLTIQFYLRNYIEGLFLSSGVIISPDHTMEEILKVVKKLRLVHKFNGYIHVKAIPGASMELIHQTGLYADRMSVNIELPSEASLKILAPHKKREAILSPMAYIGSQSLASKEERKLARYAPKFVPAGQSTQLIVGASPESDFQIIKLSEGLYDKMNLKRVFYSAYIPVNTDNRLPALSTPPLLREHRLYQADWLLRFYEFKADELLDPDHPFLDTSLDPKAFWAINNLHLFPIEVNKADYEMLLRIPGLGVLSAKRIIKARRFAPLTFETLKKIGVALKRARYFITCQGKMYDTYAMNEASIRARLVADSADRRSRQIEQLSLF